MSPVVDVQHPAPISVTLAGVSGRWMNRLNLATVSVSVAGLVTTSGLGRWLASAQLLLTVLGLLSGRSEPRRSDGIVVLVLTTGLYSGWGYVAADVQPVAVVLLAVTMIYVGLMAPRPFAEVSLGATPVAFLVGLVVADAGGELFSGIACAALTCAAVGLLLFGIRLTTERKLQMQLDALAEANARLDQLIRVDPLTGMANRRQLEETLAEAWEAGRVRAAPVSLLMIDIDHFKQYNDCYGHPGGDRCLREVAAALAQGARAGDVVARYGGEEFAIVMPGTGAADALAVAERIRLSVAAMRIQHEAELSGIVSVSVGVASAVPGDGAAVADLVGQADAALYEAKRRGRDRVGVSPWHAGQ